MECTEKFLKIKFTSESYFCYDRDREAILNDLRVDLALQFDFLFSATHVEVISGKQEGIYSWIAVNHALGKFDHFLHSGYFTIYYTILYTFLAC